MGTNGRTGKLNVGRALQEGRARREEANDPTRRTMRMIEEGMGMMFPKPVTEDEGRPEAVTSAFAGLASALQRYHDDMIAAGNREGAVIVDEIMQEVEGLEQKLGQADGES